MNTQTQESTTAWTSPENRGVCGFCGKKEGGYAKQDAHGVWKAACWPCVRPVGDFPVQKRKQVGRTVMEDLDSDEKLRALEKEAKKKKGMAPSTYRPKVL